MINYSVIIPHYNYGKKIKKLLDTIPDREDIEVIIVDDLSTEKELNNLLDTIKTSNKRNINLLYNSKENKGPGGARNLGINSSSGKWLIFADSDDYFLDGAFDEFDKNKDREEEVLYFYMTSIDEETGKISDRHIWYNKNLARCEKEIKKENYKKHIIKIISPCGKMIKRQYILKNNIYFGRGFCGEDQIFSAKLIVLSNNINVIHNQVYCILKREGSITEKDEERLHWETLNSFIEVDTFLKETNNIDYRNYYILFLFKSLKFGRKTFFKTLKIIRENNLKLFTKEFFIKLINPKIVWRFILSNIKNRSI